MRCECISWREMENQYGIEIWEVIITLGPAGPGKPGIPYGPYIPWTRSYL